MQILFNFIIIKRIKQIHAYINVYKLVNTVWVEVKETVEYN